jgi:hypothetical protein
MPLLALSTRALLSCLLGREVLLGTQHAACASRLAALYTATSEDEVRSLNAVLSARC